MYYAGAHVLSGRCLDAAFAVVKLQQTKWMQDNLMAYSHTHSGWLIQLSNGVHILLECDLP